MYYIVELEEGVWLAPWDGDPGRTLKKEFATQFCCKDSAIRKLKDAEDFRPFVSSKIVKIK